MCDLFFIAHALVIRGTYSNKSSFFCNRKRKVKANGKEYKTSKYSYSITATRRTNACHVMALVTFRCFPATTYI